MISLTSFIHNKDVRERFRQEFKKPRIVFKKDLLAPPLTKRYALIGTAFDYLLRFYLKYLNPDAITKQWIAEHVLSSPGSPLLKNVEVNLTIGKVVGFTETDLTRKAQWIIEQAKKVYSNYISSGEMTDEVIKNSLYLAQLDPIIRARIIDENIGTVYEEDVADLRKLISVVNPDIFMAQEVCVLNPTFWEASNLKVGGDADLFIDNTIIEIKTTKKIELQRAYFDQLIGYYVLHEIAGIGDLKPKPEITKVAIYFSRYAYLYVLDLQKIINKNTFPDFVRWFKDRANKE